MFLSNAQAKTSPSPDYIGPTSSKMTGHGSDSSNTPDFAFEPPAMAASSSGSFDNTLKTPNPSNGMSTPGISFNGGFAHPYPPPFFSTSGSSFSSSTGTSFSSTDALPAISRDFHRPSTSETRRPATAAGALQSFGIFDERRERDDGKPETIDESTESMFSNPFATKEDSKQGNNQDHNDLHSRRASDPQSNFPPDLSVSTSWNNTTPEQPHSSTSQSAHASYPLSSAPPHITQFSYMNMPNAQAQMQLNRANTMAYATRPQTSDGLPSYGGINPNGVSLPPARTLVNQINPSTTFAPHALSSYLGNTSGIPYRDARAASLGDIHAQPSTIFPGNRHYSMSSADKNELTFVPLGGPTPKKRPRRRYDEIERLYLCGWNGCEKSYGTLNHLNAHVAMQKHGEKRLPSEFKDMRKAWRKKKREQAAAAANQQYMATSTTWNPRNSISSSEDFDRRESNASFASTSDYSHRGSAAYASGYGWDSSRPNTSSSVASSSDGRFPITGTSAYAAGMINPAPAVRRPSAPGHMPIPQSGSAFKTDDHLTPTPQNPYPRQGAPPFHFQGLPMLAGSQQQFAFQR